MTLRTRALGAALLAASALSARDARAQLFTGTPFTYAEGTNAIGSVIAVGSFAVTSLTVRVGLRDPNADDVRVQLVYTPTSTGNNIIFDLVPFLNTSGTTMDRQFDGTYAFTSGAGSLFPAAAAGAIASGEWRDPLLAGFFGLGQSRQGDYRVFVTELRRDGTGGGEVTGVELAFNGAGAVSTVPEPTTLALVAPMMAAGALVARRRGTRDGTGDGTRGS
jgi:hypothetical protein